MVLERLGQHQQRSPSRVFNYHLDLSSSGMGVLSFHSTSLCTLLSRVIDGDWGNERKWRLKVAGLLFSCSGYTCEYFQVSKFFLAIIMMVTSLTRSHFDWWAYIMWYDTWCIVTSPGMRWCAKAYIYLLSSRIYFNTRETQSNLSD